MLSRLAAPLMLAASVLVAQPVPGRRGATFVYEAADGTFSVVFPLPNAMVQPARIPGAGIYVILLGDDGETQYGVGVYDIDGSHIIPSDLLQTWTRPAALGFATSAVRTDSVVRLGTLVGRAGRIEGEDTSGPPFTPGGHRVQVYRVFLVGQRLFHVWAASLHGRALPPDAPAFLESLKIQCDPSRPCGRGTGATVAPNPTQTWYDFQVERPAREIPDSPAPRYPDALKAAKVAGEVVTQFVVDTLGIPDTLSFKVFLSTNDLFTAAVREILPRMRFLPAELGGRKVRQFVRKSFVFALEKPPGT